MSNSASFIISYDGIALEDHSMDVRELAPALLSIGQLFDEANRSINDNKTEIKLQVKALNAGSFEVVFDLIQSFPEQLISVLSGKTVTSILNLQGLVIGAGTGLFWLLKKLKGKTPENIQDLKNGTVRIQIETVTLTIPHDLLRLYQDVAVRTAIEKILNPLTKEGISSFSIRENQKAELTKIEKEEVKYFTVPPIEDEIVNKSAEYESAYSIVSLAFKDDNKWRLHDGSSTIYATIRDTDFIRKVDENLISFTKGDILICKVKSTQWRTNQGLKTEYEVLKVITHQPSARQIKLNIEEIKSEPDEPEEKEN